MTSDVWLDTLRIARDHGSLDDLLPPGVAGLNDCPYTIFDAIRMGALFLGWDELPKDERPPRSIWLDGEKLEDWFNMVNKRRDEKYGGKGGSGQIEDPVQNEAAKGLIVGHG